MPYTVSTLYEATTVILTSSQSAAATLPVMTVGGRRGGSPPQLDPLPTVQFSAGASGTAVPVTGRGLAAGQPVQIAGAWTALAQPSADGLRFTLPHNTPAGPQIVRLGARDGGGEPRPISGSRPQTLCIRPELRRIRLDRAKAAVTVTVAPPVRPGQQAVLSLVGTAPAGDTSAASAQITTIPAAPAAQLAFALPPQLPAGEYLALVEVDGVTSLPVVVDGRYGSPTVELTR